ncbi:MAG: methylamine utilization protein MauE [Betaproteobacteria bacterium]|jgi:hypothetical protein|nr:methylamine utilization protein MauE [Betaproteobacteria bacterium]
MVPAPMLDPTLPYMCAATLAIIFIGGAWQKLSDRDAFAMAVEQYRLVPESWTGAIAWGLPLSELMAGGLMLVTAARTWGVLLVLVLLLAVTAAVAVNLLRGRSHIDCGCGGPEGGQHLSWGLVVRNLLLAVMALAAVAAESSRKLVWLDGLTVAAGTLGLYGLYAAANQLMANHPRLMNLRS